jgi:hypothetical protein
MTTEPKKGGARKGAGRKPVGQNPKQWFVSLNEQQRATLKTLGGANWLRATLDAESKK